MNDDTDLVDDTDPTDDTDLDDDTDLHDDTDLMNHADLLADLDFGSDRSDGESPETDHTVRAAAQPLTVERPETVGWHDVAASMRRFWALFVPIAIAAIVAAVIVGQNDADAFRSEVDLVFAPSVDLPETYETADALDILNDRILQGTFIELAESRTLRSVAIDVAQLDGDVLVDAEVDGTIALEANVVTVGVDAPSSADAVALNTALADVTIERFQQLYPIIEVSIVDDPTVPDGPTGADLLQAVVLALAAAFLLWVVLAVVLGRIRP